MTSMLPEGFENKIMCAERNKYLENKTKMLTTGAFIKFNLTTNDKYPSNSFGASKSRYPTIPINFEEGTIDFKNRLDLLSKRIVDIALEQRINLNLVVGIFE